MWKNRSAQAQMRLKQAPACCWLRVTLLFLFLLPALGATARAEGAWQGEWQLNTTSGGDVLILEQQGRQVTGSFHSGFGRVEAETEGRKIEGVLLFHGLREGFSAVLGEDGQSFSGTNEAGEWISAVKLGREGSATGTKVDLGSPRATLRTFLNAVNTRAWGQPGAMSWAARAIDFGEATAWDSIEAQFSAAEQLFILIDSATFSLANVPQQVSQPELQLSLPVLDTDLTVDITLRRNARGEWLIVMPPTEALREQFTALQAKGVRLERGPADYRLLQSPRDTVRAFLDAMSRWSNGGVEDATATMDLAQVSDVIRTEQAQLASHYLVRIIDRAGTMLLQTIPNNGTSREPFVYLDNPEGRIVIAPVGTDKDIRWKFTYDTTKDIHHLFRAVQHLPDASVLDPSMIPPSTTMALRQWVTTAAPSLSLPLRENAILEYWQFIGVLLLIVLIAIVAVVLRKLVARALQHLGLEKRLARAQLLADALSIIAGMVMAHQIYTLFGLPPLAREFTLPVVGPILIFVLAYLAWQIVNAAALLIEHHADKTATQIDNILLTFAVGVVRMGIMVAAVLGISHILSLPTTGILAGLGFGGLAVAFASKETLSNIFGAGILLGDRPFQKGDRIVAGDINGWVESVGLRSTRIRTLYDSLLVVPNGKLADASIDNMGARRKRTLLTTLPITSGGTPETLTAFTDAIRARLENDPDFLPQSSEVNINGIGANSIQIEIFAALATRSGYLSRGTIHKLFLDILRIAKEHDLGLGRGMDKDPVYYLQEG